MNQFKAMKFWIGDDRNLSEKIQNLLFDRGYGWAAVKLKRINNLESKAIFSYEDGSIMMDSSITTKSHFDEYNGYGKVIGFKEINIDWMRSAKPETIELNGKKYIKSELEEALKHIRTIEE